MELHRPLKIVTPTVDGDVLAALAAADAAFTGRQLHRVLGRHSADGVRRVLKRLAAQGIVTVETVGPSKVYRLNHEHLAAPHIVALSTLGEVLSQRLGERFAAWRIPPVYAALFGSAVRGEMRAESDIDLFVVRPDAVPADDPAWNDQIHHLARDASTWTGNDVRVLDLSEAEVVTGIGQGAGVVVAIRDEGRSLYGDSSYLRHVEVPHRHDREGLHSNRPSGKAQEGRRVP